MAVTERVRELLTHHVERCGRILESLKRCPKTARELAVAYFEPSLLKGAGIIMAENEILSHCELLQACGDVIPSDDGRFEATGTSTFESAIDALEPDHR
jgi:hypothetical protein